MQMAKLLKEERPANNNDTRGGNRRTKGGPGRLLRSLEPLARTTATAPCLVPGLDSKEVRYEEFCVGALVGPWETAGRVVGAW